MKALCSAILLVFAASASIGHAQAKTESTPGTQTEDWVYLDNGKLRLGVIRSSGGSIGFLAQSCSPRNLLNHFDRGRLVQQSYYGDSDGSLWDKRPWRYNPVQGGDYRGKRPRLLELRSDRQAFTPSQFHFIGPQARSCPSASWSSGSRWMAFSFTPASR